MYISAYSLVYITAGIKAVLNEEKEKSVQGHMGEKLDIDIRKRNSGYSKYLVKEYIL